MNLVYRQVRTKQVIEKHTLLEWKTFHTFSFF